MLVNYQTKFSPLFRIRRLLWISRLFLGFPLKAKNKEFNDFEFNPCLEYFRYSLYLLLFFLSNCYTTYAVLEQNGFSNPLRSIKDHFSKMGGFTVLDIAVFYSIANILLVSNTFHFFSFKKKSENISDILLSQTDLNKQVYTLRDQKLTRKMQSKLSFKLVVFETFLASLILIVYIIWVFTALEEGILSDTTTTNGQKIPLLVTCVVMTSCWVYPGVSMSSDIIVCHTLEEMSEIYYEWNAVLRIYMELLGESQVSSSQKEGQNQQHTSRYCNNNKSW